jgi:hypothetical protein
MKLITLEIPHDTTALPGWLEHHLVGSDLGALVAELEAVHGRAAKTLRLEQVLGRHRESVLGRGLAALPADGLRRLLLQPALLLDLQELILTSGGQHWIDLAASEPEHQQAAERGWRRLGASLAAEGTANEAGQSDPAPSGAGRSFWSRHRWLASLATAATVLLAVILIMNRGVDKPGGSVVATSGWGWNKAGALPQDLPRKDYFGRLADGAHEWFNMRPDDQLALARRIAEFRHGCSVLILSPHRPLSADDRGWLVEKCRAWAAKFDGYLAAVEAGEDPLKVREKADETINRLIDTLQGRARIQM